MGAGAVDTTVPRDGAACVADEETLGAGRGAAVAVVDRDAADGAAGAGAAVAMEGPIRTLDTATVTVTAIASRDSLRREPFRAVDRVVLTSTPP
ncbi:hypothetical protein ACFY3U_16225 [Micromonospora sp. NPDC000089]|uniref:hypothetical protein n=1 Tax=Micromonospora sp. NPDC000089 TaxID=3364213 RepID=UPI00367DCF8F